MVLWTREKKDVQQFGTLEPVAIPQCVCVGLNGTSKYLARAMRGLDALRIFGMPHVDKAAAKTSCLLYEIRTLGSPGEFR